MGSFASRSPVTAACTIAAGNADVDVTMFEIPKRTAVPATAAIVGIVVILGFMR